jgi:hypothetical protein
LGKDEALDYMVVSFTVEVLGLERLGVRGEWRGRGVVGVVEHGAESLN